MSHMTYLEASVVGLIQGVTELFPVSSLGHNVLIPALVGGSWSADLNVASSESPYLAFIVGLHVATAIGMVIYFWRDWLRIIGGFFSSIRHGQVETADQKLAWMIIAATIPVGIVGLVFEHAFRVLFAQPIRAAIFLLINGLILLAGERFRTSKSKAADAAIAAGTHPANAAPAADDAISATPAAAAAASATTASGTTVSAGDPGPPGAARAGSGAGPSSHASGHRAVRKQEMATAIESDQRVSALGFVRAIIIGSAQILALLAGISRDGVVMVTGMFSGLSREDAARFSFLLSTPVIFAAGVLKAGDLLGPLGNGIRGQVLVGSILSGIGAYVAVRFLLRYVQTRTLTPFAIYCIVFGLGSIIYLKVK
jgi:undecaprenyl-diphosphatase